MTHSKMYEMRCEGYTMSEIATVAKISRERVRQIIKKHYGHTNPKAPKRKSVRIKREILSEKLFDGPWKEHTFALEGRAHVRLRKRVKSIRHRDTNKVTLTYFDVRGNFLKEEVSEIITEGVYPEYQVKGQCTHPICRSCEIILNDDHEDCMAQKPFLNNNNDGLCDSCSERLCNSS